MNRKIILLSCLVLMFFCVGCSATNYKNKTEDKSTDSITDVKVNESFIDDIKKRGYLIVGCKMDVPELSLYDKEKDNWSGLEIELAYKTAAKLFEVSIDEAKNKDLVHFVGVTVADREKVLEAGDIDCMLATYTITEERKERFAFSESYYTDYVGIMVLDKGHDNDSLGETGINSLADLGGKYIGVPKNATTRDDLMSYIDTMNTIKVNPIFSEYDGYEILKKALLDGNIDAFAVDVSILNGYDDENTKILNDRFAGQHYGAAVKKENVRLLDYINQAVTE